jgi:hypothetical protein
MSSPKTRRPLNFRTPDEVYADLRELRRRGYTPSGNWNLSQVCNHLAYFAECTLDGFDFRVPWLIRTLFGGFLKRQVLSSRKMPAGGYTPQRVLPTPDLDEVEAVARLTRALERLFREPGPFHPSPLFGTMSRDEWRELHLIHCSHHLSFLAPNPT